MSALAAINNTDICVGSYKLAPAIRLSERLLTNNDIEIVTHLADYEDFGILVEFRTPVGFISDIRDEYSISLKKAKEMALEIMKDKLRSIGIPTLAQQNIRVVDKGNGAWVHAECKFFIEPRKQLAIDPNIKRQIKFNFDEFYAEASLAAIINSDLPVSYSYSADDTEETKIHKFGRYLTTAIPWEAQWLLEYSFYVESIKCNDVVAFQFQPHDSDVFSYRAGYNPDTAGLVIFEFAVHPAIP